MPTQYIVLQQDTGKCEQKDVHLSTTLLVNKILVRILNPFLISQNLKVSYARSLKTAFMALHWVQS